MSLDKECATCGVVKTVRDFYIHSRSGKPVAHCKPCYRERSRRQHADQRQRQPEVGRARALKHRYGISLSEYNDRLARQGGGCAVCGRSSAGRQPLHVDHDHSTGVIRGLLCGRCNGGMSYVDDPGLLQALMVYKERG